MFCKDCGQPRDSYRQQRRDGTADVIETCRNPKCDLCDVTLDVRTWQTITSDQLEAYREMNRKMRAGAA